MLRSVAREVMWVGRATSSVVGLAILVALAVGAANSALAHTNVDNNLFHLGHSNVTTTPTNLISTLVADAPKPVLIVHNKSDGPAVELRVGNPDADSPIPPNDVAPMRVVSNKVVTNLNADTLDGKDSSHFMTHNSTLKSGQTLVGVWAVAAPGTTNSAVFAVDTIEFRPKLPADLPSSNVHCVTSTPTANCPGQGQAVRGHLCVYEAFSNSVNFDEFHNPSSGNSSGVGEEGIVLFLQSLSPPRATRAGRERSRRPRTSSQFPAGATRRSGHSSYPYSPNAVDGAVS